jgi:hypothetical protein
VLGRHLEQLAARALPAEHGELVTLCAEARGHLMRSVRFVQALDDREYTDYVSRRLVDLSCDALAAHLLLDQTGQDSARQTVAEKFIHDALPRIRMQADYITSGQRLTIEKRAALL